jgi:hypothetical protein
MINIVNSLETNLQNQLQDLISKIRTQEAQLNILKEGYLKVQGALELIETLKNSENASDQEENEGE